LEILKKKLLEQDVLLADGAMGTSLFQIGLEPGDPPEIWNLYQSKKIESHYQSFIEVDSDIILTNSFGANSLRLKLHGLSNRTFEISKISAEIGRDAIDKSNKKIILAGSVGPTGELIEPIGTLNYKDAVEVFHEQIEGLKEGGVDLIWGETISDPAEYKAISEAASLAKIRWFGTMSFDTKGNTMMGCTPVNLVSLIEKLPFKPLAAGANCGVGPADLIRSVIDMKGALFPLIAKANAGIPEFSDGEIHYSGTPSLMAEYAVLARRAGAKIIGGCCGTSAKHVEAMKTALSISRENSELSFEEIQAKLGKFSGVPGSRKRRKRISKNQKSK